MESTESQGIGTGSRFCFVADHLFHDTLLAVA